MQERLRVPIQAASARQFPNGGLGFPLCKRFDARSLTQISQPLEVVSKQDKDVDKGDVYTVKGEQKGCKRGVL